MSNSLLCLFGTSRNTDSPAPAVAPASVSTPASASVDMNIVPEPVPASASPGIAAIESATLVANIDTAATPAGPETAVVEAPIAPVGADVVSESEHVVNNILPVISEWSEPAQASSVEPVAPGSPCVVEGVACPRDPLARPQAENASEVCAAGSQVAFANAPVAADPGVLPVASWCRRCVCLISRDPLKARSGFICTRHEHAPCCYCV